MLFFHIGFKQYCCKGFCMDLLKELAKKINITYELLLSPDGQFGSYIIRNSTGKYCTTYWPRPPTSNPTPHSQSSNRIPYQILYVFLFIIQITFLSYLNHNDYTSLILGELWKSQNLWFCHILHAICTSSHLVPLFLMTKQNTIQIQNSYYWYTVTLDGSK